MDIGWGLMHAKCKETGLSVSWTITNEGGHPYKLHRGEIVIKRGELDEMMVEFEKLRKTVQWVQGPKGQLKLF